MWTPRRPSEFSVDICKGQKIDYRPINDLCPSTGWLLLASPPTIGECPQHTPPCHGVCQGGGRVAPMCSGFTSLCSDLWVQQRYPGTCGTLQRGEEQLHGAAESESPSTEDTSDDSMSEPEIQISTFINGALVGGLVHTCCQ